MNPFKSVKFQHVPVYGWGKAHPSIYNTVRIKIYDYYFLLQHIEKICFWFFFFFVFFLFFTNKRWPWKNSKFLLERNQKISSRCIYYLHLTHKCSFYAEHLFYCLSLPLTTLTGMENGVVLLWFSNESKEIEMKNFFLELL